MYSSSVIRVHMRTGYSRNGHPIKIRVWYSKEVISDYRACLEQPSSLSVCKSLMPKSGLLIRSQLSRLILSDSHP